MKVGRLEETNEKLRKKDSWKKCMKKYQNICKENQTLKN